MTGTTLGNVADTLAYNGFAEPTSYNAAYNGTNFFAQQFTYDKLGRITQKVETVSGLTNTFGYAYDQTGRLTGVNINGGQITYAYDSNGNRLSRNVGGITIDGTYDAQDRLTQYGNMTYGYTANGELQSKTIGAQTVQYSYDVLGNLRSVTLPSGTQIEYVIDGQDRRTGKRVNGTLVQGFLYQDALNPVAELDGQNNVVSRFVYGSRDNVPDYMIREGATFRIISDHLGSPRLVVNVSTGTVMQRMEYDEFGVVLMDTNPGFQPFGFAGGLYDRDTGLVRFGARDYDAQTGCWTAKDPILFAGGDTNLYGYVLNDPINFSDPSGLQSPLDGLRGLFCPRETPDQERRRLQREAAEKAERERRRAVEERAREAERARRFVEDQRRSREIDEALRRATRDFERRSFEEAARRSAERELEEATRRSAEAERAFRSRMLSRRR